MARAKEAGKIISGLKQAVVRYDANRCVELSRVALEKGITADYAVEKGLSAGMARVNELYRTQKYCLSELLVCVDALKAGLEVFRPHIRSKAVMRTVSYL
ncbi:MAG: B12 binding domain protein [Syntrophorhabdaceae bacterium PtaU1.Bin034]|jgi:methanogenic corrinoid protein MtbC1|nr:MAG: B12 binding domain protein [Syntrophorhabdaceae bacterium PtaU1.Bin034]